MNCKTEVVARRQKSQGGNVIIEFALVAPFLMLLLAGVFTIGMSLNRSIQCSNVCRNANGVAVAAPARGDPRCANFIVP